MQSQQDLATCDLRGQIAVATGGGRGIGRAIAEELANAGATVAVISRNIAELDETVAGIRAAGGQSYSFPADVTDPGAIRAAIFKIEEVLGPIDLLVNNAGVVGPIGPFAGNDPDDWWRTIEVNLRGPALCMQIVLKGMTERFRGRIINISSGGATAAITHFSSYVTAKTALTRLTECLARELKPFGISVFAVNPGTVRTKMSEHSLQSPEGQKWFPWFREIFDQGLDLSPKHAAELVVALASGRADALSGFMLHPADDINGILENLDSVLREKLYTLRLRTLPAASTSATSAFASIRDAGEAGSGIVLRMEYSFRAPRESVFDAWIRPEAVTEWFITPEIHHWIQAPVLDARRGGRYSFLVGKAGQIFHLHGAYIEVQQPRKLSFTWQWDENVPIPGAPGDTIVTVEFLEKGAETTLQLTHQRFPNEAARDAHRVGWARCFSGISKFLSDKSPSESQGAG